MHVLIQPALCNTPIPLSLYLDISVLDSQDQQETQKANACLILTEAFKNMIQI